MKAFRANAAPWSRTESSAARAFFVSIAALGVALLLALYSGAAAEIGQLGLASATALGALALAGWVSVTLVPVLARRTPLRWIGGRVEYRVTREGWIYLGAIFLIALAAINTGNNLLFLILAAMVALILMSGILSAITLAGLQLRFELPEHMFAGKPVRAVVELKNEKTTLPSFSLHVEPAVASKGTAEPVLGNALPGKPLLGEPLLGKPVYFPFLRRHSAARQNVSVTFARRGVYKQDAFRIATRFPFGFLRKARRIELPAEVLVYPSVEPSEEFLEIMPGLQGALESLSKGTGTDLYALRTYLPTDSVRLVHWKASARLGELLVREFSRDDDCRVLLVLDPQAPDSNAAQTAAEGFERAVQLCASLAWHFRERKALLQFRTAGFATELQPADENIFAILRALAAVQPAQKPGGPGILEELAAVPDIFKVVVTSRLRGSIPASLWQSTYVIFLEDLARH